MKKKITINYCSKRTFNLGDYENIAPIHTITEEIELNDGDDYTADEYHKDFARLKKIVRNEMHEEALRVKTKDMTYPSAQQVSKILSLCKEKKLDVDEQVKKTGYPSLGGLTAKAAEELINNLKDYENQCKKEVS